MSNPEDPPGIFMICSLHGYALLTTYERDNLQQNVFKF